MVPITGNTYPVRSQLAAMGGKWSPALGGWLVPADRAEEARAAVAAAPVPARRCAGPAVRGPRTCAGCGCRINYGKYCGKCEYA